MVSILNSASCPCARITAGAFAVGLLAVCSADGQSGGSEFTNFTLSGGETREVVATAFYRSMRVCNHTDSAGPITATIDNQIQHQLAPGVCARDLGGSVLLHNLSSGVARGDYRILIAESSARPPA
jgi:hypothetical protein